MCEVFVHHLELAVDLSFPSRSSQLGELVSSDHLAGHIAGVEQEVHALEAQRLSQRSR